MTNTGNTPGYEGRFDMETPYDETSDTKALTESILPPYEAGQKTFKEGIKAAEGGTIWTKQDFSKDASLQQLPESTLESLRTLAKSNHYNDSGMPTTQFSEQFTQVTSRKELSELLGRI